VLVEETNRDHPEGEPDRCRLSCTKRSRAGVEWRSRIHGLRVFDSFAILSVYSSFHSCPLPSASCPFANYNVRFRRFLPLSRLVRFAPNSGDRCNDKTFSLSSLQNRKKKRKRMAKVICMLQPDLFLLFLLLLLLSSYRPFPHAILKTIIHFVKT